MGSNAGPYASAGSGGTINLNAPNDDYKLELDTSKVVVEAPRLSMSSESLPVGCDKFRILIIGTAGVGKSTICSAVFGVPPEQTGVSHRKVGTPKEQVWVPMTYPGINESLILHDSGGFEASDIENVAEVVKFIDYHRTSTDPSQQIHCIWYCIASDAPRPITKAEDRFFKEIDIGCIPIVVVFTRFDELVANHESRLRRQNRRGRRARHSDEDLEQLALSEANTDYYENCQGEFQKRFGHWTGVAMTRVGIPPEDLEDGIIDPSHGIESLVTVTKSMMGDNMKVLWTAAQRYSADDKLEESIKQGISVFWKVIGANSVPFIPFVGATALYAAFRRLLVKISPIWNLPGTADLIKTHRARNQFLKGCFGVEVGDVFGEQFLAAIGIFGPMNAPLTATQVLEMIAGISLVHERLFWELRLDPSKALTRDVLKKVVNEFGRSEERTTMHSRLVARISIANCYSKDKCLEELRQAMKLGRSELGKDLVRKRTVTGNHSRG